MVNNNGLDDGLDERLPSPTWFDHVLVRARIGGSTYWLDGTFPPVARPSDTPIIPYRWVLPLSERGSSIERQTWSPAEVPNLLTLFELDARAGFDLPARIVTTTILRGLPGLQQQVQFSALTPAQLLSGMRQSLIGDTWQTIESAEWRFDEDSQASVLVISGTGAVEWDDDSDGMKELALPGGGFNPPERRIRPAEQNQDLPFYNEPSFTCYVTTVRLPQSTRAENWAFNTSLNTRMFGRNFYRVFEMRDGAVRMVRGSRVEQLEIDPDTARRDNARIGGFDNSMAWITYNPAFRTPSHQSGTRVPATFEIDWTDENVPCLASRAVSNVSPNVPTAAPGQPVRARGNIANLISYMDYPVEALRTGAQGTTRVKLAVDESGIVTGCSTLASSGHEILDQATCNLLRSRAVFTPARDADGRPVPDTVNSPPIRWSIQGPVPPPADPK